MTVTEDEDDPPTIKCSDYMTERNGLRKLDAAQMFYLNVYESRNNIFSKPYIIIFFSSNF